MTDSMTPKLATTPPESCYPLLFGKRWNAGGLADAIAGVAIDALIGEYHLLRADAPRRSLSNRRYFERRPGLAHSLRASNRREERIAVELLRNKAACLWTTGSSLRLLDYQVPLKGRRADTGVGKIDLLGVTGAGRLVIAELKVIPESGGRGDSPMAALMEGLRYAAMVEADLGPIRQQIFDSFGIMVSAAPPCVAVLGEHSWWEAWDEVRAAGAWQHAMDSLIAKLASALGIEIACLSLNAELAVSVRPTVMLASHPATVCAAKQTRSHDPQTAYLHSLNHRLWDWAEQHLPDVLVSARRTNGPPVLSREAAHLNIIVPDEPAAAATIRALIPTGHRHTHFGSLRSSQALAQSVFGLIQVLGRQAKLAQVTAECGRPAFGHWEDGWKFELEHEVRTLGEPRPTSIDVLMRREGYQIAVECKFTEAEFGRCSRMQIKPKDEESMRKSCDGSYTVQQGRQERCALTEIGVRYWDYLPHLFGWARDVDHMPCTFGDVYQLARNAMAVTQSCQTGHVLVVYDEDNPAFGPDGFARRQWDAAVTACRQPGLLRRVSWQALLTAVVQDPLLEPVMTNVRAKYFGTERSRDGDLPIAFALERNGHSSPT